MTTTRHTPIPPQWRVVVRLCLVALGIAGVITIGQSLQPSSFASAVTTACPGTQTTCEGSGVSDGGLDLWRGITRPGTPGGPGSSTQPGTGESTRPDCAHERYVVPGCVRDPISAVDPPVSARPPLSLRDLAHFVPRTPGLATEPTGWGIAGLPTNLIADCSRHSRLGTVLGYNVEVVFYPVAYEWVFGDGQRSVTASPGQRWAQAGLAEFSVTSTSHSYRRSGTFRVSVTAVYGVSYRYSDTGWRFVAGHVRATSPELTLLIARFDRALVSVR